MNDNILDRIIKPENCILAFAIPTTRDDFIRDLKRPDKDFAKHVSGGWMQYKFSVVDYLDKWEAHLKKLGVTILHQLTLDDFGDLFATYGDDKIIVLFSHWKKFPNPKPDDRIPDEIEFSDGLKSPQDVIGNIPADFNGFLDLNVCQCGDLAEALRRYRPQCYFGYRTDARDKGRGRAVNVIYKLRFYITLLKHMERSQMTYLNAYRKVAQGFQSLQDKLYIKNKRISADRT